MELPFVSGQQWQTPTGPGRHAVEFWVEPVGQVENFELALASIWPVEVREGRESC